MLHFSSGRLSEIRSLTANLEAQRDEATRQGREAQTQREIRAAQDRLRTVQRSSEDLRGELERMRIANTSARISTRDALPSFQGQPASSSRQSHRKTANSSNTGSTSAPQGSREASRTTHNPDIRPSTTLETRSSRQQHHRASRSEDVPQGNSSNYGQPTAYQPGASSGQGFGQATGTQPFSDYQPPSGFQQNVVPQAPSFQAPPIQQPTYYRGYTSSDISPSLTRASRQGDSTESSGDEYVDDRGSPYRVNRRQFRDVAGVSVRRNTEAAPGHRSHHRSASGSGEYEPTAIPSQGTGRPSSSSHRRSSSNASNTAAGSSRLPPIGGSTLPGPAVGLPRQTAAPIPPYQSYRPSSPLPQPSQQLAPEYRFPPPNPSSLSYPAHSQSGPTDNRYPTGRAPPNAGTMTAQMQQLSFNQYNQQSAPVGQGSGIPMSEASIGYLQQPHGRRASSPNTRVNAYQNNVPRRMSTPPLGAHTMSSSPMYPASYQPTQTPRRGASPGRLGPRVQLHGTQRQSGTSLPLGSPNSTVGPSMSPTGHTRQPSGPRGRDTSPLRSGPYGTSGQGRNLTPPRGTRGRRQ
ncbi:hypothetical protein ACKRZS_007424 [Fusarium odoratissimum]